MDLIHVPTTAHGVAKLATPGELEKEQLNCIITTDAGDILTADSGDVLLGDVLGTGFTNPNLHRRVDDEAIFEPDVDYPFSPRDPNGNPYKQSVVFGVWDRINSYRTTTTYEHDEESTTCEIP